MLWYILFCPVELIMSGDRPELNDVMKCVVRILVELTPFDIWQLSSKAIIISKYNFIWIAVTLLDDYFLYHCFPKIRQLPKISAYSYQLFNRVNAIVSYYNFVKLYYLLSSESPWRWLPSPSRLQWATPLCTAPTPRRFWWRLIIGWWRRAYYKHNSSGEGSADTGTRPQRCAKEECTQKDCAN